MANAVADVLELVRDIAPGSWVAIAEAQPCVIAVGEDAESVLREAQSNGEEQPLMLRVPNRTASMFF